MSNAARIDAVSLSALMSSRLCHDLVNPIGALSAGLEVLGDSGMDSAMKEAAIDLIKSSAEKSVALLKYARLAYGASGGLGAELPFDEARNVLAAMFAWSKATLEWNIAPVQAPKDEVRAVLILALAAADCVPRGGTVSVSGGRGAYDIRVTGARILVHDDFAPALAGEPAELKAKFTPHYLAGLMARQAGGAVAVDRNDESFSLDLRFSAVSSKAGGRALTAG